VTGSSEGIPRLHILLGEDRLTGRALPGSARLYGLVRPLALHVRASLPAARLFAAAARLAEAAAGGWCVVNGRPDIALAAGAHAVQLGHAALTVRDVDALRKGTDLRIGASVHRPEEAVSAARDGADFLVVGTMYETPSHPGRAGRGPAGLARVAAALAAGGLGDVPLLGIGGVDAERIGSLIEAGAYGAVVGRAVWSAADPGAAAVRIAAALAAAGE